MFIKPIDHIQKTRPFSKPYKGIVVSTNDPRKLNRVKVNIPDFLEGDEDSLPWVFPWNPPGLGGRPDLSSSMVPVLNSELVIEFPFEDIYSGFYTGYWHSDGTHQGSVFNEDYPDSYGFRDEQGTHFKVNKAKKFFELQHTSGAKVFIDSESIIKLISRKAIQFVSEDGKTLIEFDTVSGEMNLTPKEKVNISANEINLSGAKQDSQLGSENKEIDGGQTVKMLGGRKLQIAGSDSQNVVGSRVESIAGDTSKLVGGTTETTWGQGHDETAAFGNMLLTLIAGNRNIDIIIGNYKIDLLAGNYDVDIKKGNVTIRTLSGSLELGNPFGEMKISPTGAIEITATRTLDLLATGVATLKGSLTKLGTGRSPVITVFTDPIEDYITGIPKRGVPLVLAGS